MKHIGEKLDTLLVAVDFTTYNARRGNTCCSNC